MSTDQVIWSCQLVSVTSTGHLHSHQFNNQQSQMHCYLRNINIMTFNLEDSLLVSWLWTRICWYLATHGSLLKLTLRKIVSELDWSAESGLGKDVKWLKKIQLSLLTCRTSCWKKNSRLFLSNLVWVIFSIFLSNYCLNFKEMLNVITNLQWHFT